MENNGAGHAGDLPGRPPPPPPPTSEYRGELFGLRTSTYVTLLGRLAERLEVFLVGVLKSPVLRALWYRSAQPVVEVNLLAFSDIEIGHSDSGSELERGERTEFV